MRMYGMYVNVLGILIKYVRAVRIVNVRDVTRYRYTTSAYDMGTAGCNGDEVSSKTLAYFLRSAPSTSVA